MANFGRLRIQLNKTNAQGLELPASGVSVEVRRQGAQVAGNQSGTPINVDAINGILSGDTIVKNETSTPTKTVTAITATTMSLSGGGFASVSDDDRITATNSLVSLFVDATGVESTS